MATKISSSIRRFGTEVFEEQTLLVNISLESLNRFTNWKSNRPVDYMKVDEIIKSIKSGLFTPPSPFLLKKRTKRLKKLFLYLLEGKY